MWEMEKCPGPRRSRKTNSTSLVGGRQRSDPPSPPPLSPGDMNPRGLQCQMLWGPCPQVAFLQVGVADVGCEPFTPRGKLWDRRSLLTVGCTRVAFGTRVLSAFPAYFDEFPSHLPMRRDGSARFWIFFFFSEIWCVLGGGGFRILPVCIQTRTSSDSALTFRKLNPFSSYASLLQWPPVEFPRFLLKFFSALVTFVMNDGQHYCEPSLDLV